MHIHLLKCIYIFLNAYAFKTNAYIYCICSKNTLWANAKSLTGACADNYQN